MDKPNTVLLLSHTVRLFFDTHALSDINGEKDMDTLEDLASALNAFNWKTIRPEFDNWGNPYVPYPSLVGFIDNWQVNVGHDIHNQHTDSSLESYTKLVGKSRTVFSLSENAASHGKDLSRLLVTLDPTSLLLRNLNHALHRI